MPDPIAFNSSSPRLALPMLFAGQSQKEVTVNEALILTDLLLHPVVEGTLATPPTTPSLGQSWIVGNAATGAFAGQSGRIAAWTEGGWRFIAPMTGMRVYDLGIGSHRIFNGTWTRSAAPSAATGGTVVDTQARAVLASVIGLLKDAGIFSAA